MSLLDYTELSELARDLGNLSSPQAVNNVQTAVGVTAHRIKDAWNAKLYRDGHARLTGRSISYDVGVARDFSLWQTDALHGADSATIVAEIGPKRLGGAAVRARGEAKLKGEAPPSGGRQAGIVRLLENGSVNNPPHGYGAAALHENEADFEHGIAVAIWAAERDAGLG